MARFPCAGQHDRIEVTARIDGLEQQENVEIRAFQSHGGVTVCAVRKGSAECDEKLLSAPGTRVNYKVHVPTGVNLAARTVNGTIEAHRLSSDVQATTVNGSIDAALLHGIWTKAPEFSAVNGKILIDIPNNTRTGVNAETRNGRIVASLPGFRGTSTEQVLSGTIGRAAGGANCLPILIRAVNGSIELRQNF